MHAAAVGVKGMLAGGRRAQVGARTGRSMADGPKKDGPKKDGPARGGHKHGRTDLDGELTAN